MLSAFCDAKAILVPKWEKVTFHSSKDILPRRILNMADSNATFFV